MFSPFYFIRMDDLEKQILDFRWKTKGSVEAGFTLAAKKKKDSAFEDIVPGSFVYS